MFYYWRSLPVKNHVWRPLWVVIALVAVILMARLFIVPDDFGVHDTGYMYGWYRQGNLAGMERCSRANTAMTASAVNATTNAPQAWRRRRIAVIACENCHGPARTIRITPEKLAIDRSRDLCLRCHTHLPYPGSDRRKIVGIDPLQHNPGEECSTCHNPHHPNLEEM